MSENETAPRAVIADPKIEQVEYWSLVGHNGVSAIYMVRIERGERANILLNEIDHSPIQVQLLLRHDDEKNEVAATLSFPIANLFSYGMERSTYAVYPKGFSPTDAALKDAETARQGSLLMRKRRMEAILSQVTDLSDGTQPNGPTT